MTFGNPLFLWSLLLLTVPVLIHLFRFRKYKKVYFTQAVFFEKKFTDQRKIKNLKHRLILLSRLLSLLLLVIAFALPGLDVNRNKTSEVSASDHLVLVIDNHLGLHLSEANKINRFYAAKKQMKSILTSGANYKKVSVIAQNSTPQTFYHLEEAINAVDELQPAASVGSWRELNAKIERVVKGEKNSPDILLISDFLKKQDELNIIKHKFTPAIIPSFDFSSKVCVDSLWEFPVATGSFFFKSKGGSNHSDFIIYGENKPLFSALNEEGNADEFSFRFPMTMNFRYGQIVPPNSINSLQNFFFTPSTNEKKKVLVIYNENKLSENHRNKFFKMQTVDVDSVADNNLKSVNFAKYNHIILVEIDKIDDRLNRELQEFMSRNARLLLIPSLSADIVSINRFLQNFGMKLLNLQTSFTEAEKIEYQDLLFRDAFVEEIDLPQLPFFRKLYTLEISNGIPVLYTLSGKILLGKSVVNNGGILYVSASSFHPNNTNLMFHEIFNPMMYNFLHRDMTVSNPYYLCGNEYTFNFTLKVRKQDEPVRIKTPSQEEIIPLQSKRGSDFVVTFGKECTVNGIYSIWYDGKKIKDLAFNVPFNTLYKDYYHADEVAKISGNKSTELIYLSDENTTIEFNSKNQVQLWVTFVLLGILFLTVEMFLIKFMK